MCKKAHTTVLIHFTLSLNCEKMEEDPTSISDVGESGDANAQHLLGAPASFQSDSLELLKKEKAELGIFLQL